MTKWSVGGKVIGAIAWTVCAGVFVCMAPAALVYYIARLRTPEPRNHITNEGR